MKYFLDTEFMEDGKTIELLSIGLVAEDGREFYAVNELADLSKANPWVKENVIPHLRASFPNCETVPLVATPYAISRHLLNFIGSSDVNKPQFWGYYADYDWVAFCQLFGRMMDLPKGFPMFCRDIKQLCWHLGDPELPKQSTTEHHALLDARWNRQAYEFLRMYAQPTPRAQLTKEACEKIVDAVFQPL